MPFVYLAGGALAALYASGTLKTASTAAKWAAVAVVVAYAAPHIQKALK